MAAVRPRLQDRLARHAPYSYRDDAAVPKFPDDKPLILFDGVCVLCSGFVRFVVARDPGAVFRLTTAQSTIGQALLRHYGLDTVDFESNLVLSQGRAYAKLDTLAITGERIGGPWRLLGVVRVLPRALADWLYDRVARNRYALFGRHERCMMPPPDWHKRFLQ